MKIMIVGEFKWEIYEKAFYESLLNSDHEVFKFEWHQYFEREIGSIKFDFLIDIYYKFQNKYKFGPIIDKLNKNLIKKCETTNPDLIFIYRGTHISGKTIKILKENGSKVFGYNNDDPFSLIYDKLFWKKYLLSVKEYDYIFSYREKNILDYNNMNYNKTSLLRSYYISDRNYPVDVKETNEYTADVSFIGHFEDDGRDENLKLLLENGIDLKIFGGDRWKDSDHYSYFKSKVGEINPVRKNYNLAINSAKIAVVFLSKLNNDTYTRRCFEIPSSKTFMISEYTEDLAELFSENNEIVFFYNKEDLLEKVKYYLKNDDERNRIANNGYKRLLRDGHEVSDRIDEIVRIYNNLCNK